MADLTVGTSLCVKNDGTKVQITDLVVAANRIYNFVEMNRTSYFEQHSMEWALDEIINRVSRRSNAQSKLV